MIFFIQEQCGVLGNVHAERELAGFRLRRWRSLLLLRDQRLEAFRLDRRHHHKDNQEHQQYVKQRRDIDKRHSPPAAASTHSHNTTPLMSTKLLPANNVRILYAA